MEEIVFYHSSLLHHYLIGRWMRSKRNFWNSISTISPTHIQSHPSAWAPPLQLCIAKLCYARLVIMNYSNSYNPSWACRTGHWLVKEWVSLISDHCTTNHRTRMDCNRKNLILCIVVCSYCKIASRYVHIIVWTSSKLSGYHSWSKAPTCDQLYIVRKQRCPAVASRMHLACI